MSTALIIGAGPAGLMAADVLSHANVDVVVVDQMPSPARKFLMAGKSGLNLTKAQEQAAFLQAYGDAPDALKQAVVSFGADEVQAWATSLGQEIFTGSTGRVFPKVMKASPLLRAWLARLEHQHVTFKRRWRLVDLQGMDGTFETADGARTLGAEVVVLAMGGASWRRLGSDGRWAEIFGRTVPFKPANCGFAVNWSDHMRPYFGQPVKASALSAGELTSRGEWIITERGIEGGGVYEVSQAVREGACLTLDLLPDVPMHTVEARINAKRPKQSRSQFMKSALRLPPIKVALYQEFSRRSGAAAQSDARSFKALEIAHAGPLPMDEAISTAGGLPFEALDNWMLRNRPGVFAAGEMLDWEAPTGGYLITGCLATGKAAARAALSYLKLGDKPVA